MLFENKIHFIEIGCISINKKNLEIIFAQGKNGELVEIIELPANIHPFFVGVQFHPEFKSRPLRPHPLFLGLIKAGWALQKNKNAKIL